MTLVDIDAEPRFRHLLDMQVQSAGHMRETVEALLQLARSTMQPMPTQDVDVSTITSEVIARLDMKSSTGAQFEPELLLYQRPPPTEPSHMRLVCVG